VEEYLKPEYKSATMTSLSKKGAEARKEQQEEAQGEAGGENPSEEKAKTVTVEQVFGQKPEKKAKKETKKERGLRQYTEAEQAFHKILEEHRISHEQQVTFLREKELTKDGKQKVWIADFVIKNNLVFELEGPGTASDNKLRDEYFQKRQFIVVHVPNELILKHGHVIGSIIMAFILWQRPPGV
jgi:hypothetical protein